MKLRYVSIQGHLVKHYNGIGEYVATAFENEMPQAASLPPAICKIMREVRSHVSLLNNRIAKRYFQHFRLQEVDTVTCRRLRGRHSSKWKTRDRRKAGTQTAPDRSRLCRRGSSPVAGRRRCNRLRGRMERKRRRCRRQHRRDTSDCHECPSTAAEPESSNKLENSIKTDIRTLHLKRNAQRKMENTRRSLDQRTRGQRIR